MGRSKNFSRYNVLVKAMELFRKQGYYATSIDDLVSELGVNRASLYGTYGGKRELFIESLTFYTQNTGAILKEILDQQPKVREGFRKLFLEGIKAMKSGRVVAGCLAVNTTIELLPLDKEVLSSLVENQKRIQAIFEAFIKKGIASGEISAKKNPALIAGFLFTFNNGLGVLAKLQPEESSLAASIDEALKIFDG